MDPTAEGIRALGYRIADIVLKSEKLTFCRAVRARYLQRNPPEPLYYLGSAASGGRYTPLGGPAGLYLASDQPTACSEIQDLFTDPSGMPLPLKANDPVTMVYVEVCLQAVLDLTDFRVLRTLRVTRSTISGEWRPQMELYLQGSAPMPLTQQIGYAAHATARVGGILYPSARWKRGRCLVVFPDRLTSAGGDSVEAVDSTGRYAQRIPQPGVAGTKQDFA